MNKGKRPIRTLAKMKRIIMHQKQKMQTIGHEQMMNAERLRQHLFTGPRVPFWDYDPGKLTVGIEVEYFIAHVDRHSFRLATKNEYFQVITHLKNDFGYKDYQLVDQPGRVSLDTEHGFVAIKPDFAWHILEISLPPRSSLDSLRLLLTRVFSQVDRALAKVGLERLDISCLDHIPENIELVELDRLGQISKTFKPQSFDRPTQNPNFPAFIAATHVHLNASSEDMLAHMPKLYQIDHVISTMFTRTRSFCGRSYRNARTDMYRDTLGEDYLLHTYPKKIAEDLQTLADLMNQSPKLFPEDRFFPVRDMSYIRPTRYGTLEFRSCCSFKNLDVILDIVKWRCAQLIAGTAAEDSRTAGECSLLPKLVVGAY